MVKKGEGGGGGGSLVSNLISIATARRRRESCEGGQYRLLTRGEGARQQLFGDSGSWGWVAGARLQRKGGSLAVRENHLFPPKRRGRSCFVVDHCSMGIDVGGGSSTTIILSGVGFFIL